MAETEHETTVKRCGLYIRVSTDRQAKVEEGSLKTQDHLLSQHIECKDKVGSERWKVIDRYVDEGKSAKDTNRPAYQRMRHDILAGRINTVVCTALSRISRSTRDLLEMVEFFQQHDVDFICLKESYDTTTPQGRLFVTLMGGLNQFEREQTSERTRSAFLARAERGLWNGGYVYGYNLDHEHRGHLKINEQEAAVVRLAFETYLREGSVLRTRAILNELGYRTKVYTSRRDKPHPAAPFSHGAMYQMLTNYAYIGKREVNKHHKRRKQDELPEEQRYRIVPAVWPAIVSEELFYKVQELLRQNAEVNNNMANPSKHFYLLNGGFLRCERCGTQMEGRNAWGHKGKKAYYYYYCKNRECRFRLGQGEVEHACAELIAQAAKSDGVLPQIVNRLNQRLKMDLPTLLQQRQRAENELKQVNAEAQDVLTKADLLNGGRIFAEERLKELAERRRGLETELGQLSGDISAADGDEVDEQAVRHMLDDCHNAFGEERPPYQRRELLRHIFEYLAISDTLCCVGIRLKPAILNSGWFEGATTFPKVERGAKISRLFAVSIR